jgi:hypothetical protein
MSLLTRWAARAAQGHPAKAAKTAKRGDAFGRAAAHNSQLSQFSRSSLLNSAQDSAEPCPDCGGGSFVRAPGDGWRCHGCARPPLPPAHEQAGWAFLSVAPPSTPRPHLPMPPSSPLAEVYLDEVLPDLATAPVARCSRCYWTAPLSTAGLCGRCVLKLVEAGNLATDPSPPVPPTPSWTDNAAWCRRLAQAGTAAARIGVLAGWAAAAGGTVLESELRLPPGLPAGLALATLRAHGRMLRLVEAIDSQPCADRKAGRILAAAERAVASPNALLDPAEVMLRGEIP